MIEASQREFISSFEFEYRGISTVISVSVGITIEVQIENFVSCLRIDKCIDGFFYRNELISLQ